MRRLIDSLGSLKIAVPLLVTIALVLGWGTIYEARFGTAAVQRFVYHSWWFQGLLAFLAVNLAVAALQRYPWQRRHAPFVLAHIGIILILLGGILGGRFGVEGQLIIPEGEAERVLQLPGNVLVVRERNPGIDHVIRTNFEAAAWNHEPHAVFRLPFPHRAIELTVDRYYPDAAVTEDVTDGGQVENPALRIAVRHDAQQGEAWLFARDPQRFGVRWEEAHLLFFDAGTDVKLQQFFDAGGADAADRGSLLIEFPTLGITRQMSVPVQADVTQEIEGTPYRITFKDYFADLAITDQGLVNRSDQPNNPAVSLILSGPEGADPYLVFALHPDFQQVHGIQHEIPAHVRYTHPHPTLGALLPPQAVSVIRTPSRTLAAVLTDAEGNRTRIAPIEIGRWYPHPSLGYDFEVLAYSPHAKIVQQYTNRGSEVKSQAVHLVGREGSETAEAWLGAGGSVELLLGHDPLLVSYRPATRELPVTVKLLDFRKIDYPGTQMAAGFESDVELTDPQRGLILMRMIRMNHPLRYRGFSFYQSSYLPGPPETTVLSVRSDPGTPLVYLGFLIVMAGVISMFVLRDPSATATDARGGR